MHWSQEGQKFSFSFESFSSKFELYCYNDVYMSEFTQTRYNPPYETQLHSVTWLSFPKQCLPEHDSTEGSCLLRFFRRYWCHFHTYIQHQKQGICKELWVIQSSGPAAEEQVGINTRRTWEIAQHLVRQFLWRNPVRKGDTKWLIAIEIWKQACLAFSQHCACWWPGTARCQEIYRHNDNQIQVLYILVHWTVTSMVTVTWLQQQIFHLYIELHFYIPKSIIIMIK